MNEVDQIVQFRVERARETLEEAHLMAAGDHWNTCMNRLYYACFYATTALQVRYGLASSKHSGVRALLHQHFVKPSILSVELGHLYDQLFEARQEGDYSDFVVLREEDVRPRIPAAEQFVAHIERLLSRQEQAEA